MSFVSATHIKTLVLLLICRAVLGVRLADFTCEPLGYFMLKSVFNMLGLTGKSGLFTLVPIGKYWLFKPNSTKIYLADRPF